VKSIDNMFKKKSVLTNTVFIFSGIFIFRL
jgi:hypothetical protein